MEGPRVNWAVSCCLISFHTWVVWGRRAASHLYFIEARGAGKTETEQTLEMKTYFFPFECLRNATQPCLEEPSGVLPPPKSYLTPPPPTGGATSPWGLHSTKSAFWNHFLLCLSLPSSCELPGILSPRASHCVRQSRCSINVCQAIDCASHTKCLIPEI